MFRKKEKKVYPQMTKDEIRQMIHGLIFFRNEVIRVGGPTEDIDALLIKLGKKLRRIA